MIGLMMTIGLGNIVLPMEKRAKSRDGSGIGRSNVGRPSQPKAMGEAGRISP